MSHYNVDAIVIRTKGTNQGFGAGHVGKVLYVDWDRHKGNNDYGWVKLTDNHEGFASSFRLATAEEVLAWENAEAIKLLEAAGYTITPPKPKLTGEVVVYQFKGVAGTYLMPYEDWKTFTKKEKDRRSVLAIVPWTEGDGVEATEKPTESV